MVDYFEWDELNLQKIADHGVSVGEAEDANDLLDWQRNHRGPDRVYVKGEIGGREIVVSFECAGEPDFHYVRIVPPTSRR